MQYSSEINTKKTPQSQPILGKTMVENNAGGFVFEVDKWTRLDRFLILGSERGTYYVHQQKLTKENAASIVECIREDGPKAVRRIVDISVSGRAPKNSPAIFALALAATFGDAHTKQYSYACIFEICRTGTHLFEFCQSIQDLRGWSRGLRRAVAKWYLLKSDKDLAYQLIKYRQRNGWTHRDVLRLSHPKAQQESKNNLLKYAVGKAKPHDLPPQIIAYEQMQGANEQDAVKYIIDYNLPRECVPTQLLKSKIIWDALLHKMPLTAMVRNLSTMTASGLLVSNFDEATQLVCSKLSEEAILKSKIHPIQILLALKTYASGRGFKGKLTWTPVQKIVDQLNEAFYMAFKNVESTKKNYLIGLDVSGSMSSATPGSNLSARVATSAISLVIARTEPAHQICAFSDGFVPLTISPFARLEHVCEATEKLPFSNTDCALPMLAAIQNNLPIDVFLILTDNETWTGSIHPKQALDKYRQKSGRNAKCIVAAVTATSFSIADPTDPGMLDCAGFDASIPEVIRNFVLS